jgi:manganese transport protein
MWGSAEIAAMATDLAEFLGGAIGLSLLLGLPLPIGLVITGAVTYGLLLLGRSGFRPLEMVIGGFVAMIGLGFVAELMIAPPDWSMFAYHAAVPSLPGDDSLQLAVGIIGATVMPHAIYLHSSLTQGRVPVLTDRDRRRVLRLSNIEVVLALSVAGLVNMAMLSMAAAAFSAGHAEVAEIETAYHTLVPLFGPAAGAAFLLALLASGVSSSMVGTLAGQSVMQDFVRFRIPLWVRRLVTMLPAVIVVWLGTDATQSLVISQIILSLTLPVPMVALLLLTGRRAVMGELVNGPLTNAVAVGCAGMVLALNALLLLQAVGYDF